MADAKEKETATPLSFDCESGEKLVAKEQVQEFAESLRPDSQPDFTRGVIPETGEQVVIKERPHAVARKCANALGIEVPRPVGPAILGRGHQTAAEENAPPVDPAPKGKDDKKKAA